MDFHITIIFVAIFALLQIPATVFVGMGRVATKVSVGDGGHDNLQRRIRAHGNFTETVPMTLLAMAAADAAGAADTALWVGGALLLVGRLSHFATLAFSKSGVGIGRAGGMFATFGALGLFGVTALLGVVE